MSGHQDVDAESIGVDDIVIYDFDDSPPYAAPAPVEQEKPAKEDVARTILHLGDVYQAMTKILIPVANVGAIAAQSVEEVSAKE
ncbi:hypothetical protein QQP08_015774 [Theobroma cacao]|nr:hypothetical protein QQP08_015774 [Theobroma cacao]